MRKCYCHLSNKNVKRFSGRVFAHGKVIQSADRSLQIVGPAILNDLDPSVIFLVLGMYSCPDVADRNCLRSGIEEIVIRSVAR